VFHVSLLKKQLGTRITPLTALPILTPEGTLAPEPKKILTRRLMRKGNQAETKVLVQWAGTQEEYATWEDLENLRERFSDLVGKVLYWRRLCYVPLPKLALMLLVEDGMV